MSMSIPLFINSPPSIYIFFNLHLLFTLVLVKLTYQMLDHIRSSTSLFSSIPNRVDVVTTFYGAFNQIPMFCSSVCTRDNPQTNFFPVKVWIAQPLCKIPNGYMTCTLGLNFFVLLHLHLAQCSLHITSTISAHVCIT